ncbi:MAG: hypothetical protein QF609_01420, partial [Gammaproteobacteria bacterium]|nr:hypothetical protein [Gammaproteobacteria bacterium]
ALQLDRLHLLATEQRLHLHVPVGPIVHADSSLVGVVLTGRPVDNCDDRSVTESDAAYAPLRPDCRASG